MEPLPSGVVCTPATPRRRGTPMRNTPLHESHLLEAVRRKMISSDQRERGLARARAPPADGTIADVRWATVVQGLIAAAAVMGSGLGILIDAGDNGVTLAT